MMTSFQIDFRKAFGNDKSITVQNIVKFNGKYEMIPGVTVFWTVTKGSQPKENQFQTAWNIYVVVRGAEPQDTREISTTFMISELAFPEELYRRSMRMVLELISEINVLGMNEQIFSYEINEDKESK